MAANQKIGEQTKKALFKKHEKTCVYSCLIQCYKCLFLISNFSHSLSYCDASERNSNMSTTQQQQQHLSNKFDLINRLKLPAEKGL